MQDIASVIKNLDPKELDEAINKAKAFAATAQGKEMISKLKNGRPIEGIPVSADEQKRLMAELAKNPDAAKRLTSLFGKK